MPVRHETPMYKVWEELNQTEDDGAKEWGAHDVPSAAACHARVMDREEPFETWPRYFVVIDPAGKRWRVSVDRQIEYSYRGLNKEKA